MDSLFLLCAHFPVVVSISLHRTSELSFFFFPFFFFTRWKGEGEGWGDYSFIEVTTSTHRIPDQKNRTKKKDSQYVTIIYLYRSGDPRSQAWLAGIVPY